MKVVGGHEVTFNTWRIFLIESYNFINVNEIRLR